MGTKLALGTGAKPFLAPQDAEVNLLELGGRVDAELAGEQLAGFGVHRERLGLAAGRVERTHEKSTGTFGKRVGVEQSAELAHETGTLAESHVGLDPVGQDTGAQFRQPGRGRGREVAPARVSEGLPPPGEQRIPQYRR